MSWVKKNGSTIALITAGVLAVISLINVIKASKEGAKVLNEYDEAEAEAEAENNEQKKAEAKIDKIKGLITVYKGPIVLMGLSVVCGALAHKMDLNRIIELGSSLALSERKLDRLYEYVEKKIEGGKAEVEKHMEGHDEPPFDNFERAKRKRKYIKEEPVNFKDTYTGTAFESSMNDYYAACDRASYVLSRKGGYGLSYNKFRSLLGLEDIPAGQNVGWKAGEFKSYLQESIIDGEPYFLICYSKFPHSGYWE